MKNMNCAEVQNELSAYLDDALGEERAVDVRGHVAACPECGAQAGQLGALRGVLRAHARVKAPADLALQVRMRISHESTPRASVFSSMFVHFGNFLRPVAIPAASGLLTAVLTFGSFIYHFAMPLEIPNDVPLALQTQPKLRTMPQITFATSADGVLVQAEVDYQGRITNYTVLNGGGDEKQMRELRHALLFAQFDPATRFGVPISGRTIFNLSRISVKG